MNLGFYYHIPAIQENNSIYMPGYLGRFLDAMAGHCETLILFQHQSNPGENTHFDYQIQSGNTTLIQLPSRGSVPHRMLHTPKFTRIIKNHLSSMDGLLLRGPTPLLPPIAKASKHTPIILLIIGDHLAGIETLPQPRWRKEMIRLWSWVNLKAQDKISKRSLVFVNSQAIYQHYQHKITHLEQTRTTTLSKTDFFLREDTCLNKPIRLLYTGRMDPAKGLLDMIEAISLLIKDGKDVILDLVGWPEAGSDILAQIQKKATKSGVEDRFFFHGYKAVGPELFAYYKEADIYLIASQSSFEGFPRTIWEAMAHSLPVVATRVGSIPEFIEDAAVLVLPKDSQALANGIKRLIDNTQLRKQNIRKGFSLAGQNTLEVQVGEMAKVIHAWLEEQHG